MTANDELNVVYQCDEAYAEFLRGSVASLLDNNRLIPKLNVHVLDAGLSEPSTQALRELVAGYGREVRFYETAKYDHFCRQNNVPQWRGKYITWYKLLSVTDLQGITSDRILYINPQCLVTGHLDGLLEFDFSGRLFGLSYECILTERHKRRLGLDPSDGYFNCGVMLVNLSKWKQDDITEKNMRSLSEFSDYMIVDQDFINVKYHDEIKYLGTAKYDIDTRYYTNRVDNIYRVYKFHENQNYHDRTELLASIGAPAIIYHKPLVSFPPYDKVFALWQRYFRIAGITYTPRISPVWRLLWWVRSWAPDGLALRFESSYIDISVQRHGRLHRAG